MEAEIKVATRDVIAVRRLTKHGWAHGSHTAYSDIHGLKMLGLYLLGQNCLHLTFKPYLSSETDSRKYEKLPNIVIHACKNSTEKNVFDENVWPANLAVFIYVSIHCVKTVKWLDYNRYSQLTRWCSGNASALGARAPGFNPRLPQVFLCLIFCFIVVVFLLFSKNNKLCVTKVAIPFAMLIYLVY